MTAQEFLQEVGVDTAMFEVEAESLDWADWVESRFGGISIRRTITNESEIEIGEGQLILRFYDPGSGPSHVFPSDRPIFVGLGSKFRGSIDGVDSRYSFDDAMKAASQAVSHKAGLADRLIESYSMPEVIRPGHTFSYNASRLCTINRLSDVPVTVESSDLARSLRLFDYANP